MTRGEGSSTKTTSALSHRLLFIVTLLTGSFLLFLIQPMVARMALPRLGGAPAVWNSAMLVYQALLLGGYAYAHALGRLAPRRQAIVHMALFAAAAVWLPVGLSAGAPEPGDQALIWVPWLLVASIGPLFFVVAAQAPLMQRWYGLTSRSDPYPLYAASNLGSFAGLICYPLLVEPGFALDGQSMLWSALFVALVFLVAACGSMLPHRPAADRHRAAATRLPRRRYLRWIALAAVPSGLMLSTTSHLTTDVVAVPLLWVVPLGLYLLSFTAAFAANRRVADIVTLIAPLLILSIGGLAFGEASRSPTIWGLAGLVLLFVVATALHAEMYRTRPAPEQLTGFYLALAVGGVAGGLFCALLAPLIFNWTYEHPLLILAAALLVPQRPLFDRLERLWNGPAGDRVQFALIAVVGVLLMLATRILGDLPAWVGKSAMIGLAFVAVVGVGRRVLYVLCLLALMLGFGGADMIRTAPSQSRSRSYFGVYAINARPGSGRHELMHGTTLHGLQLTGEGRERTATTYYAPMSGVGLPLVHAPALFGPSASIGIVGLGTGTLACYKQADQDWIFFEIDPQIVRIAREDGHFSFLSRCAPDARIVLGDARLTLGLQRPASLDVIALDAFSSDVVPLHLLTAEAFAVYVRALKPGGLLIVHISNRYLDLEPVLAAVARRQSWTARVRDHQPSDDETADRATRSVWVAMSRDPAVIARLEAVSGKGRWEPLAGRAGFAPWTDDYATILPLIEIPD